MPFTFSHPAAVLPLTLLPRQWYSLTGLVIGSMVPDFEYFLRMRVRSEYSHTIGGLFWFDLPLAILLAFVFHHLVRNPLIDNSPRFIISRVESYRGFDFTTYFKRKWLVVIASILVGAASHLLWDSFTHEHGFFVDAIPSLSSSILIGSWQLPVYKVLQHSSTVVGGFLIVLAVWMLPENKRVEEAVSISYWCMVFTITVLVVAIRLLSGLDYRLYGHVIATGIAAFFMALVLTPLLRFSRT
ncbi:DUF4184 family protein [Pontibacter sp. H249]|uniref:DUF4184 family protein n=1 Tax=Pontibacter sp. H249 TaxID=3133420 RepID=UPI0030BEA329